MAGKGVNSRVAGYTLIEALATLMVTGLAISVMFSIGVRGAFTGFRLGNRAIDGANSQITGQAWRNLIGDVVIPSVAVSSANAEAESEAAEEEGASDSFEGGPELLSAYVIASRSTPCLPVGGQGRLAMEIVSNGKATSITCALNGGDPQLLMDMRWPGARFSYSEDGVEWLDEWTVVRGEDVEASVDPDAEQRKVFIRLTSTDGAAEMIELAVSGRAVPQTPPAVIQTGGRG